MRCWPVTTSGCNWAVRWATSCGASQAGYADPAVLGQALQGIGRRLRRDNPLATALPLLVVRDAALQTHFEAFFPQLQAHAREGIEAHAG